MKRTITHPRRDRWLDGDGPAALILAVAFVLLCLGAGIVVRGAKAHAARPAVSPAVVVSQGGP